MGKRIYSTSARQAVQVKLMTHCNKGSHEDLLIAASGDPGFALSSPGLRWGAQVSMQPGPPHGTGWWDDASRGGGRGTGPSHICGRVALADPAACPKGCRKAADSPLPVNGVHKERGGPGMLQGLRSFPLLEVASFLFSKDVVLPRLGLFCAAGSTSAAHAEI